MSRFWERNGCRIPHSCQPSLCEQHRALADIHESIRELIYYRGTAFVPPPGPTSDQAKAVAEAVLGTTGPRER